MKSLYFVGNEELWKDAWFVALIESLKSRSMNVVLLDPEKDDKEFRKVSEHLTVYERMIFHKAFDPIPTFKKYKVNFSSDKISLVYVFSEIINASATPMQITWKADADEILKTTGLWGASQILEEAFLMDDDVVKQISKVFEKDENSLIEEKHLTADADEISQILDIQEHKANATKIEVEKFNTEVSVIPVVESKAETKAAVVAVDDLVDSQSSEQLTHEQAPHEQVNSVIEVSHLISSMSHSVSGEDLEVIKRYSSIKERELREAQAGIEALRKQIRYFDDRLKKSEEDRRKLLLKLEETENELRTVADKKDENKAQLKGIESRYEEKIKELQIQLESSQFQAGKLDKKLIDFRERVRNDLQKIRSRERELASRLEIQKRDAEALLSAKDERLLNQKREMDRLEFELDALKERLYDDAQKGEERRKRVARSLQSLKLAQSILSGLEEDVSVKEDKDKAA